MTRERCPVCDAPLATKADINEADGADEDSDLRWATALCWSLAVPAYACSGRKPVDWPARALAAEARVAELDRMRIDAEERALAAETDVGILERRAVAAEAARETAEIECCRLRGLVEKAWSACLWHTGGLSRFLFERLVSALVEAIGPERLAELQREDAGR